MLKTLTLFIFIVFVSQQLCFSSRSNEIGNQLFANYNPNFKPTDPGVPVVVNISIALRGLMELDTAKEEATVNAYLEYTWFDPLLKWKSMNHDQECILVKRHMVWIPDVQIAGQNARKAEIARPADHVTVCSDGAVTICGIWLSSVATNIQIADFPFDTQFFQFSLGSMASGINDTDVSVGSCDIGTYFSEEFKVTKFECQRKVYYFNYSLIYPIWPCVSIQVQLQRNPLYYVNYYCSNILIITVLALIGANSNQQNKIQIGLTALVGMSVLGMTMTDNVPRSENVPRIFIFLIGQVGIILAATVVSVWCEWQKSSKQKERSQKRNVYCFIAECLLTAGLTAWFLKPLYL